MGWVREIGVGGGYFWVNTETGEATMNPPNEAESEARRKLDRKRQRHMDRPKRTDKGGVVRTDWDAVRRQREGTYGEDEAAARAAQDARNTRRAQQARIDKAKEEAARLARIQRRQARIIAQAKKRGKVINKKLARQIARIEDKKKQNLARIEGLRVDAANARADGDYDAAAAYEAQQKEAAQAALRNDKRLTDIKSGKVRAISNEKLRLRTALNNEKLTEEEKRAARQDFRDRKEELIEKSGTPALSRARYSNLKAGDEGRGKLLQAALRELASISLTHPEYFDEDALAWVMGEIDTHDTAVKKKTDFINQRFENNIAAIQSKKPGTKGYNAALRRARKNYNELNGEALRRELRLLYGPLLKTDKKGNPIKKKGKYILHNGKKVSAAAAMERGLLWESSLSANAMYESYENHYWANAFKTPEGTWVEGFDEEKAAQSRVDAEAMYNKATKTRRWMDDPLTGKRRKQTTEERLLELQREDLEKAQKLLDAGFQFYQDYEAAQAVWRDDPYLKHLADVLSEEEVRDNAQLTGAFGIEKREDIIVKAQERAWEEFQSGPDFKVPGVAEGIWSVENYGEDEQGRFFAAVDGSILRPGGPLPEGHPEPRWDLDANGKDPSTEVVRAGLGLIAPITWGLSLVAAQHVDFDNSFDRALAQQIDLYRNRQHQAIEDAFRAQMGISDPGFLGDVFRQNAVGELIATVDAIPGAGAHFLRNQLKANLGMSGFVSGNYGRRVALAESSLESDLWVKDEKGETLLDERGKPKKFYKYDEFGIYDYDRYHLTPEGARSFTFEDGLTVIEGDEMPEGYPEPIWVHSGDPSKSIFERYSAGEDPFAKSLIGVREWHWETDYGKLADEAWEAIPAQYREMDMNKTGEFDDFRVVYATGVRPGAPSGEAALEHGTGNLFTDFLVSAGFGSDTIYATDDNGAVYLSSVVYTPIGAMEFVTLESGEVLADIAQQNKDLDNALEDGDFGIVARVLGSNELFQFGNMAGAMNFAWYILGDPTNFIPGITLAKKGLAGVRAMKGAQNVPAGLKKVAFLADKFVTGFKADPQKEASLLHVKNTLAQFKPSATEPDVWRALKESLGDLDPTSGENIVDQWARALSRRFGLDELGIDHRQVRAFAEENIRTAFEFRGYIMRTQADELVEHARKMAELVEVRKAEQKMIDKAVLARQRRWLERVGDEGEGGAQQFAEERARAERITQAAHDQVNLIMKNAQEYIGLGPEQQTLATRRLNAELRRMKAAYRQSKVGSDANLRLKQAITMLEERISATSGGIMMGDMRPTGRYGEVPGTHRRIGQARRSRRVKARRRLGASSDQGKSVEELSMEAKKARDQRLRLDTQIERQAARKARMRIIESRRRSGLEESAARDKGHLEDIPGKMPPELKRLFGVPAMKRFIRPVRTAFIHASGPAYWTDILARAPRAATRAVDDLVADGLEMVRTTAMRYGRFSLEDAATKAWYNYRVRSFLERVNFSGKEWRALHTEAVRRQYMHIDSYEWTSRKYVSSDGKSIIDDTGAVLFDLPEHLQLEEFTRRFREVAYDADGRFQGVDSDLANWYTAGVRRGTIMPADAAEASFEFFRQMYTSEGFSGVQALAYLKQMRRLEARGVANALESAKQQLRVMFHDELMDWRYKAAEAQTNGRTAWAKDLNDSPIGTLHAALFDEPAWEVSKIMEKGGFAHVPGTGVKRGYHGERSIPEALARLERAVEGGGVATLEAQQSIDDLARAMLYEQMTPKDWEVTRQVVHILRKAHGRSNTGRVAKSLRARIELEMDLLGFDDPARIRIVNLDDMAPVSGDIQRTFRGIGGTVQRGPSAYVGSTGWGGQVHGPGIYTAIKPGIAISYANGGPTASLLYKQTELLDLRYFFGDMARPSGEATLGEQIGRLRAKTYRRGDPRRQQQLLIENELNKFEKFVAILNTHLTDPIDLDTAKFEDVFEMYRQGEHHLGREAPTFKAFTAAMEEAGLKGIAIDVAHTGIPPGGEDVYYVFSMDPSFFTVEHLDVANVVPIDGVSAATVATAQAKAIQNEFGMSELQWLRQRAKRIHGQINNPKVSKGYREYLIKQHERIQLAIAHVEVEKGLKRYEMPRTTMDNAMKGAESVRDRVRGVLPEKSYSFYAENPQQVVTEVMRSVWTHIKEARVHAEAFDPEIDRVVRWFPFQQWKQLNDEVGLAVQQVQGKRGSSLGLRKLKTSDDELPELLQTTRDFDPELNAVKQQAITDWLAANNINETLTVEQYDRMRTILQRHVQKGTRTELLIEEARKMPGDFTENFLKLRAARVEDNAVRNVAWTMIENPGMTVEEATRQFELSWAGDGRLREPPQAITQSDHDLLIAFFEQNTGGSILDQPHVKNVLQSHGTVPPLDKKWAFQDYMRRTGEWSPRALDEIDDSHVWSLREQYDFFMTRYGEAPAWVTDGRFKLGPNGEPPAAFWSREAYFEAQLDVGSFDQQLQVRRALGEELVPDYEALAVGVVEEGQQIIRPAKDVAQERRWMVDFYGDAIGRYNADGTVTLTAAPWLMNMDELRVWRQKMTGVTDLEDLGPVIIDEAELVELQWAIGELADKHVDRWIKATNTVAIADNPPVIPSSVVHRISFDMVQELATTQAWRGVWRHFRNGRVLDAWGAFWRAVVVSSPAFIVSNVIDTPTKALWFTVFDRWSVRASEKWVNEIQGVESLGIGGSAFFYDVNKRGILDRIRPSTTYGRMDQLGGFWDLATNALARNILQPVEMRVKTDLARRIATGLDEELRPLLRRQGHSDRVIDQLILIQTKERILKLFPSLDNAGFAERLLNKVFPFISYNFKNKVLWTSEVIEHPWIVPVVLELQEMLIEYNVEEWKRDHPGEPVPEWLMHKIRIPGTDMFIDLGMFTDAARGAAPIMGDYNSIGDFFNGFIRPLPSQMAFVKKVGWDLFGLFGRERWDKVLDEHGIHTGEYDKVIVPPGTPWGDRPLDYLKDLLWPVNLAQIVRDTLEDGTMTGAEAVRVLGGLVSFGEFSTPSRYYHLNATYFSLMETNPEAARRWLDTEDGMELREYWKQKWYQPTDTKLPWVAFKAKELEGADPDVIRRAWFSSISPETREKMFRDWDDMSAYDAWWDDAIDTAHPGDRERLWTLRRTFFHQFYVQRPYLWVYEGFGLSPDELAERQMKLLLDEERNVFYSLYSWALAPDDAKARAQWEKEREEWLEAHPELKASFAEVKDTWDEDVRLDMEAMERAIRINARLDALIDAAYDRDDEKAANEFRSWRKTQQWAFERERLGFDSDRGEGEYRFSPDNLTNRLLAAAGNKAAEKEVLYPQRMAAVIRETGDDPLEFWKTMNRHPDLREQYWEKNPEKRKNWQQQGEYLKFWRDMDALADSGQWDEYWDNWDASPQWVKDMFQDNNPSGYKSFVRSFRYNNYMGRWVAYFDRGDNAGAARYWDSLPNWVKERYYSRHPGKRMSSGRGSAYVSMLNQMFDQIDAGNWDAAERIWKSAPAWMRRRYYANNPDSTLFRGGTGGSGGTGGGLSDVKYKKYVRMMQKWVDLIRDGKQDAADAYFKSLPKWAQDFYLARHPDKALLKEDMEIMSLVEEYLIANPDAQRAMLANSPKLRRWLKENDTEFARRAAIEFVYSRLPDDPWLRRVFREKYPEIFSKEAKGEAYKKRTFDILQNNPDLVGPWQKWYEDIFKTMTEALKWLSPRPAPLEVERKRRRVAGHGKGLSAEEVAERRDEVADFIKRNIYATNKRLPKLDTAQ